MRRWLLGGAAVVVVALLAVGAGWYLHVKHAARDIHGSSTVEFVPTPPPPKPKEPGVAWPMYGHDGQRLRVATGISLAPPFRHVWTFGARSLIREHASQQIVRAHALYRRRNLTTTGKPRHRQRSRSIPFPARAEHRRIEHGLR